MNRQGLAGQQRFVNFQPLDSQQPQVGRDAISGFQPNDVSRNNLFGPDFAYFAVSHHLRTDAEQLLQCVAAFLRPPLLVRANDGVDRQHGGDKGRILNIANHHAHNRGDHQNVDERVNELPQHDQPQRGGALLRQCVRPIFAEAASGLLRAQAPVCRLQRTVDRLQVQRMPSMLLLFRRETSQRYSLHESAFVP